MTLNRKVAVTGGIGSGKSEACKILSENGYPVISCDEVYAELLNTHDFAAMMQKHFPGVSDKNGLIDRKKLSEIVFADRQKLHKLTELTNPTVMKEALSRMNGYEGTVLCEVPLLFENGYEKYFDDVIIILRDYDKRVESIIKRSNLTEKEAKERMNSQFDYDSLNLSMYYAVHNNDTINDLNNEILKTLLEIDNKIQ